MKNVFNILALVGLALALSACEERGHHPAPPGPHASAPAGGAPKGVSPAAEDAFAKAESIVEKADQAERNAKVLAVRAEQAERDAKDLALRMLTDQVAAERLRAALDAAAWAKTAEDKAKENYASAKTLKAMAGEEAKRSSDSLTGLVKTADEALNIGSVRGTRANALNSHSDSAKASPTASAHTTQQATVMAIITAAGFVVTSVGVAVVIYRRRSGGKRRLELEVTVDGRKYDASRNLAPGEGVSIKPDGTTTWVGANRRSEDLTLRLDASGRMSLSNTENWSLNEQPAHDGDRVRDHHVLNTPNHGVTLLVRGIARPHTAKHRNTALAS